MKLILAAPSFIPARTANSIQSMKMAQAFAELGHQVLVLAPGQDPGVSWEALAGHYGLQQQFEIEWLAAMPALRRYDYGLRVVRRARHWGAELLFTRLPQAAAIASKGGFPSVLEVHDMPPGRMGPRLLGTFLGGIGQGVCPCLRKAIRANGGWLDVGFDVTPRLHTHTGFGIDDPNVEEDALFGRAYNQFLFTNVSYDVTNKLNLGLELSYWKTLYFESRDDAGVPLATPSPGESYRLEFVTRYGF